MILELITCDVCDWTDQMPSGVVPFSWLVSDGKHYCSYPCWRAVHGGDAA